MMQTAVSTHSTSSHYEVLLLK